MILYLDTSSLLRLYLPEPFSGEVLQWATAADAVAISRVGLTEAVAGLAARSRRGDLARALLGRTLRDALGPDGLAFTSFDGELVKAAVAEKLLVLEPADA